MPKERREALVKAYCGDVERTGDGAAYPRITVAKPNQPFQEVHVEADLSRARTVRLGWLKEDELVEKLRASLANGGCAVVIRNTVGLAQDTYLRLKDEFQDEIADANLQIDLFHAAFRSAGGNKSRRTFWRDTAKGRRASRLIPRGRAKQF